MSPPPLSAAPPVPLVRAARTSAVAARQLEARDVGGVQIVEDDDHGSIVRRAHGAHEAIEGDDPLRALHVAGDAPEQLVEIEPELANRLRPRPVRGRVPDLPGAAETDACTARLGLRRQGACQRALADAGLAGSRRAFHPTALRRLRERARRPRGARSVRRAASRQSIGETGRALSS